MRTAHDRVEGLAGATNLDGLCRGLDAPMELPDGTRLIWEANLVLAGLSVVVFAGNVGDASTRCDAVDILRQERHA